MEKTDPSIVRSACQRAWSDKSNSGTVYKRRMVHLSCDQDDYWSVQKRLSERRHSPGRSRRRACPKHAQYLDSGDSEDARNLRCQ